MKLNLNEKRGPGRPLAFNPEEAVDAAMRVFWLKGYEGASVNDLATAMGISKPSLYAKFGDKRGLFLSALDHYTKTVTGAHVVPLLKSETVQEALSGYFRSIINAIASTGSPPGCLIGTIATDLAGRDDEIREQVANMVASGEEFLAERIRQIGGAPIDERVLAELVISIGQSLAARARLGADPSELNALCDRFVSNIFSAPTAESV